VLTRFFLFKKICLVGHVAEYTKCHPEHIRFAQCKLREGSLRLANLRDSSPPRADQNDKTSVFVVRRQPLVVPASHLFAEANRCGDKILAYHIFFCYNIFNYNYYFMTMKATKTKSAFTIDFLDKIKLMLTKEHDDLVQEMSKFAKKDPHSEDDFDTTFPSYGDKDDENAAEVADYVVNLSLEDKLEKSLHDVTQALKRLSVGSYGICKYCSKPIEEKRLLARPQSSACLACKKAIKQEI